MNLNNRDVIVQDSVVSTNERGQETNHYHNVTPWKAVSRVRMVYTHVPWSMKDFARRVPRSCIDEKHQPAIEREDKRGIGGDMK